ncbi:protodermal factor 1 [Euphorbia lathyris]|uniref:protodermal factor 1 n=1 Tax=Euphorbia lathyris TaxID=212925 RepID=UPI0033140475
MGMEKLSISLWLLVIPLVMAADFQNQKTYYSPPSDPHHGAPSHHGGGTTPSHGGGGGTSPSHGGGGGGGGTSPSHGGGGGGHSSPSNPSPGNCGTPPSVPTPTPSNPPSSGGGGYYPTPPTSGGSPPTPTTPYTPTPLTPSPTTPSPSTPSPTTPYVPTPSTPTTPSPPFVPIDPNSPFPCNYWRNHPGIVWGLVGWWGTVGNAFGGASLPGIGTSSVSLQQLLSNTRSDGYGTLYREGTASLLNSMVTHKFPYTTMQVRDRFISALSSNKAAAAQGRLFKMANNNKLKP